MAPKKRVPQGEQLFREDTSASPEPAAEVAAMAEGHEAESEAGPSSSAAATTVTTVVLEEEGEGDVEMADGRMRPEGSDGLPPRTPPSPSARARAAEAEAKREDGGSRSSLGLGEAGDDETSNGDGSDKDLLASLPVYLSDSLPATSTLHVFQYPTYPRGRPLPVPEGARSRGLAESVRWKARSNHVEVELPLDMRPAVYNLDRGTDMAKGASPDEDGSGGGSGGGGGGGDALDGAGGGGARGTARRPRVKREGGIGAGPAGTITGEKRLERTRLKSSLVPNQTNYLVGVVRDKALHLTPLHSVLQLRPSMHYLDGLDELSEAEKRRGGAETDDGGDADEGPAAAAAAAAAAPARKAQNINVSIRASGQDGGGRGGHPGSGSGGGGGGPMDSRDVLMAAQREAEGEKWVDLEWSNESDIGARKALDGQMFASSKRPLTCLTRPRQFLEC